MRYVPVVVAAGAALLLGGARAADRDEMCHTTKRMVVVNFQPNSRYRHILDHIWDVTPPRGHKPVVLHIKRSEATANLRISLRESHLPPLPDQDRDEYPPAMSDEGGHGADVRYVPDSENQASGASMSAQLREYCDGQRFRFEFKPGPR
jgi:hypothetical protein